MANASDSKTTQGGRSSANSPVGQKKTLATKSTKKKTTSKAGTGKSSSKTKTVFQVSGSLEVLSAEVEVDVPMGGVETADYVVDPIGRCFRTSTMTVQINGRPRIVSMNAKETQYLLLLLRVL